MAIWLHPKTFLEKLKYMSLHVSWSQVGCHILMLSLPEKNSYTKDLKNKGLIPPSPIPTPHPQQNIAPSLCATKMM